MVWVMEEVLLTGIEYEVLVSFLFNTLVEGLMLMVQRGAPIMATPCQTPNPSSSSRKKQHCVVERPIDLDSFCSFGLYMRRSVELSIRLIFSICVLLKFGKTMDVCAVRLRVYVVYNNLRVGG